MNLWFIYFKFMTSQLCSDHSKEITVVDIIETFTNFNNLN